jgi:hypothetical protein
MCRRSTGLIVCVVCTDGRADAWEDKLREVATYGAVYIQDRRACTRYPDDADTYGEDVPPRRLDIAIVHGSDHGLWEKDKRKAEHVFVFNGPGMPLVKAGEIPIYRRTQPFEVTPEDVEQMLAYVSGERKSLPGCCRPMSKSGYQESLSILCQGYLAVAVAGGRCNGETDEVKALLNWDEFPAAVREQFTENFDERWATCTSPDYWRSSMVQDGHSLDEDDLRSALLEEIEGNAIPPKMSGLIEAMFSGQSMDRPELVLATFREYRAR